MWHLAATRQEPGREGLEDFGGWGMGVAYETAWQSYSLAGPVFRRWRVWQYWAPLVHACAAANGKPNFFMFGEVYDGSDSKCGSYTGTQAGGALTGGENGSSG